jgi:glycosyltransferase involved in cell wall biosynthesis
MVAIPKNQKCHVLHIITGLDDTGGAEMMLYKILSGMNREDSPPIVLSMESTCGPICKRIEALGVPVYSLEMRRGAPTPIAFWHLIRLVRRLQPALIQGWMYHANLLALLVKPFLSRPTPVLWNIRQSLYDLKHEKKMTAWVIRICAMLSRMPARILYNSEVGAIHHEAVGYASSKRLIILNGFAVEIFSPSEEARAQVRQELGLSPTAILIGLVGRYDPIKNHKNFILAADHLSNSYPDVHFLLVGNNVDDKNKILIDLINNKKLNNNFHLLGEREDINTLTAALDISTCCSHGEGFPNVVGEAMSCEVPCVVTDVGDSAAVVGETGIVVPPRDSLALANGWKELLDMGVEKRKHLGKSARERIISNYSIEKIASQYEALYTDQLSKNP